MDERVIVFMGATGSGKSSLIRLATGDQDVTVGHSLISGETSVDYFLGSCICALLTLVFTTETRSITVHPFDISGIRLSLVDTPGFDDTHLSDREVLETVSTWLSTTYRKGTRVSAIVYAYRISDPRMQGSALRNFRIFRQLCGEECFTRVTLCTTFWDMYETEPDIPNARLKELESPEFWGDMIDKGSKIIKAPTDMQNARICFLSMTSPYKTVMQIQREIVDDGKRLHETAAMLSFLDLELKRQQEEHERFMQEAKARWQEEMAAREAERVNDREAMRKLEAELEEQRAATQAAEATIRRRMSEQASQKEELLKQWEQLSRHRTTSDHTSHIEAAAAARQQRFDRYTEAVMNAVTQLRVAVNNGQVKCGWRAVKECYTLVCNHCLMSIGRKEHFRMSSSPCHKVKADSPQKIAPHAQAISLSTYVSDVTTATKSPAIL